MDVLFDLVEEVTGARGMTAAILVGIVLAGLACVASLIVQAIAGK